MWVVGGKSVIGTAHERAAIPCQDFWITQSCAQETGRKVIAIADGAGFAKYADFAARISTEHVVNEMRSYSGALKDIGELDVLGWLSSVRRRLVSESEELEAKIVDLSATLLVAIFEGDEAFFWQVGDGGWVIQTDSGIEVATWPDSGEFINETVFSVSERAAGAFSNVYVKGIRAILGFTDGLEHLCLNYITKSVHAPLVTKLFAALEGNPEVGLLERQLGALLSSTLVNDRTDDDKTMVLAWKIPDVSHVS